MSDDCDILSIQPQSNVYNASNLALLPESAAPDVQKQLRDEMAKLKAQAMNWAINGN